MAIDECAERESISPFFASWESEQAWPTYRSGREAGYFSIVESLGGGVALIDFDRDGRCDLFASGGGELDSSKTPRPVACRLLRSKSIVENRVGTPFSQDASQQASIVNALHYSHGVAAADFDNDGFVDLLVTGYGGLQLWKNIGDGTFADFTATSQLFDDSWSTSAAWGDLNGDSWPDLYVCHYVDWSPSNDPPCQGLSPEGRDVCSPIRFRGLSDVVFLSSGDGTFRAAAGELGLVTEGKGLAVTLFDADRDGDLDVYVANDTTPNFFYSNQSNDDAEDVPAKALFVESGLISGLALDDMARPNGSMGTVVFDQNNDGLPDLFVTNYENELFALYEGSGQGAFRYRSRKAGLHKLGQAFVGFGCVGGDFDLDGQEEVAVANGHAIYFPVNSSYAQKPLLLDPAAGRFWQANAGAYFEQPNVGRGVATADLNADGKLDLVFTHTDTPLAVLQNQSESTGTSLVIRLVGTQSARDAVGSHVAVLLKSTGQMLHRTVASGMSYLSTSSSDVHFGIPEGEEVDSILVTWPSGQVNECTNENSLILLDGVQVVVEPKLILEHFESESK